MNDLQSAAITAALLGAGFTNLSAEVSDDGICALIGSCRSEEALGRASDIVAGFEPSGLLVDGVEFAPTQADSAMADLISAAITGAGHDVTVSFDQGVVVLEGVVKDEEAEDTILNIVENFGVDEIDIQLVNSEMADWDGEGEFEDTDDPSTYTVQKGDSWWRIAKNTLGSGSKWKLLKKHNGSPKVIHPGQVLNIPELEVG